MAFAIPVKCRCEAPIWRTIFGTEQLNMCGQRVVACVRCGTSGAVRSRFGEPDMRDAVPIIGVDIMEIAPNHLAWLDAWPIRVGDPERFWSKSGEVFFLPRASRFTDAIELERAEAEARESSAARFDERLLAAGVPSDPPPPNLPKLFWFFEKAWKHLHDIEIVPANASAMYRPASWICEERLPRS